MAAVSSMQTIFASPVACGQVSRMGKLFPASNVQRMKRHRLTPVKCMAEDERKESSTQAPSKSPKVEPAPAKPQPAPSTEISTKFSDVFSFSGPAPERINGRLAMIGFVAALAVEVYKGQDVFSQLANGGVWWFLGTSAVLSIASLVPLFQGVTAESESDGIMTSDAEIWNGRFAMLGLVALALTEYVKGGALVV